MHEPDPTPVPITPIVCAHLSAAAFAAEVVGALPRTPVDLSHELHDFITCFIRDVRQRQVAHC